MSLSMHTVRGHLGIESADKPYQSSLSLPRNATRSDGSHAGFRYLTLFKFGPAEDPRNI